MARVIERGDLLKLSAEELEVARATEKYKRGLKKRRSVNERESHHPKTSQTRTRQYDATADAQYAAYQRYGLVDDYDCDGFTA